MKDCLNCNGTGKTSVVLVDKKGNEQLNTYDCVSCNGTGQIQTLGEVHDRQDYENQEAINKLQVTCGKPKTR